MRRHAFTTLIIIFKAAQSAPFLPLNQRFALSRRLGCSSCEFYGYNYNNDTYNAYTIEMTGRNNGGSLNSCPPGLSIILETQCNTAPDSFDCIQVHENLHSARITFVLSVKTDVTQPDCVTKALRLTTSTHQDDQTIECICLADCSPM
ncbi:hypothetical protein ANO14919_086620 [Xylariales sp. No.14919]|nr:hypothetical protein ANO14919_086620 [Xylariales sp. No.14919]